MSEKQAKKTENNKAKKSVNFYDNPVNVRIRELMDANNTTSAMLAKQVGLSEQGVRQWTSGNSRPDIDKIIEIANYFEVSIDYLFGKVDYKSKKNEEMTVSETGLSEAAAKRIRRIGVAGVGYNDLAANEEFRVNQLQILNGLVEHNDFIKLISQIELYKRLMQTKSNDEEQCNQDEIFKAREIIEKSGLQVVDNDLAAQACLLRATRHLQKMIDDISKKCE